MPMPSKGRRTRATVRLPYDVAAAAAIKAKARRWSMSEYIAFCVERALAADARRGPNGSKEPVPQ